VYGNESPHGNIVLKSNCRLVPFRKDFAADVASELRVISLNPAPVWYVWTYNIVSLDIGNNIQ